MSKEISVYNAARAGAADYVDPSLLSVPVQGYNIKLGDFLPYLQQSAKDQGISKYNVSLRNAIPVTSLAWVRYTVDKGLDKDINGLETKLQKAIQQNQYNLALKNAANATRGALGESGGGASGAKSQTTGPLLLGVAALAYFFRKKLGFA